MISRAKTRGRPLPVTKLPPHEPAARDEGPRLLPLDIPSEVPALDHYLELADIALGTARPGARKKPRRAG